MSFVSGLINEARQVVSASGFVVLGFNRVSDDEMKLEICHPELDDYMYIELEYFEDESFFSATYWMQVRWIDLETI